MKKGLSYIVDGNEIAALLQKQAKDAKEFAEILKMRSPKKHLKIKTLAEKLDFMARHVNQQETYELSEFELQTLGIGVEDKSDNY